MTWYVKLGSFVHSAYASGRGEGSKEAQKLRALSTMCMQGVGVEGQKLAYLLCTRPDDTKMLLFLLFLSNNKGPEFTIAFYG